MSTEGQSEAAQVRLLRAAGAARVFREVASGAKTDRAQLRRLLAEISGAKRFAATTGGEPLLEIARSYNVHPSTISRLTA